MTAFGYAVHASSSAASSSSDATSTSRSDARVPSSSPKPANNRGVATGISSASRCVSMTGVSGEMASVTGASSHSASRKQRRNVSSVKTSGGTPSRYVEDAAWAASGAMSLTGDSDCYGKIENATAGFPRLLPFACLRADHRAQWVDRLRHLRRSQSLCRRRAREGGRFAGDDRPEPAARAGRGRRARTPPRRLGRGATWDRRSIDRRAKGCASGNAARGLQPMRNAAAIWSRRRYVNPPR